MDIFNINKIDLLILFFVPGFISTKIWTLIVPSAINKPSEYFFEIISYGCINFALLSWSINFFNKDIFIFLMLLIFPVLWPILIYYFFNFNFIKKIFMHPFPKAWDYYFNLKENCFILIHLKNGKLIGGYYGSKSFASSYPNSEEIYIQEVWTVNDKGKFLSPIEDSKGILIAKDSFEYIEIYEAKLEDDNDGKKLSNKGKRKRTN